MTLTTLNVHSAPKAPKKAADWICYHNPDTMTCAAEEADPHSVETAKNLNVDRLIRDRIWLIGKDGATGRFYLHGYLIVDRGKRVGAAGRKRRLILSGTHARQFRRRVRIDTEPWFARYKDEMQGLSHGLQSVRDPNLVDALLLTLSTHSVTAV